MKENPMKSLTLCSMYLCIFLIVGGGSAYSADVVIAYPRVAGLGGSVHFSVSVNGQSIPVTLYNGRSIAWFAFSGTARVLVAVSQTIGSYSLSPKRDPVPASVSGNTLSFDLTQARKLVLRKVNSLSEELFIIADPLESNPPILGASGVFDVRSFGADPTGNGGSTAAFQNAINAASGHPGGGVAYVSAGLYSINGSSLFLKSNVNLYLAPGAVVQVPPDATGVFSSRVVMAVRDLSNAKISGRGVIYGNGSKSSSGAYTHFLQASNVDNFWMQDVLMLDGRTTLLRYADARNSGATNVKIFTADNLSDGIDIDGATNFLIDSCLVCSSDDNVAIGSGTDLFHYKVPISTDGLVVKNSLFYQFLTGHVVSIVPHVSPPYIRNILIENCDSVTVAGAFALYASNGFVAVSNVTYRNIRVEEVRGVHVEMRSIDFTSWGGAANGMIEPNSGSIRNIRFENVTFDTQGHRYNAFEGRSPTQEIRDVTFHNVSIAGNPVTSKAAGFISVIGPYVYNLVFTSGSVTPPTNLAILPLPME
jgi:polygalacturonase